MGPTSSKRAVGPLNQSHPGRERIIRRPERTTQNGSDARGESMSHLTALMDRLSLTRKFALLGILIALSTTLLTYLLFRTSQTNISFAQQERLGVDYVASLPDLLEKAQHFRDL